MRLPGRRTAATAAYWLGARRRALGQAAAHVGRGPDRLSADERARTLAAAVPSRPLVVGHRGRSVLVWDPLSTTAPNDLELSCGSTQAAFESSDLDVDDLLQGENLLTGGDLMEGTRCWVLTRSSQGARLGVDLAEAWTLAGGHTGFLQQRPDQHTATVAYRDPRYGDLLPVQAGRSYTALGLFALHRARAALALAFYDDREAPIATEVCEIDADRIGGHDAGSYDQVRLQVTTPEQAAFVRVTIEKTAHVPESAGKPMGSYVFFARLGLFAGNAQTWRPQAPWVPALLAATAASASGRVFEADVPDDVITSGLMEVAVIDRRRSAPVDGSPIRLAGLSGRIDRIEPRAVGGWVEAQQGSAPPFIRVDIDGEPVAVVPTSPESRGLWRFRVDLPPEYPDDRHHHIELRDALGTSVLDWSFALLTAGAATDATQASLTPPPVPDHLTPAAANRYEALTESLRAEAKSQAGLQGSGEHERAAHLAQLAHAHDVIVRGFETNRDFRALTFPAVADPEVSIIVPAHNKFAVSYHCLCALLLARCRTTFEVIVVDDGSTDETTSIPDRISHVGYIRHEQAQGFVAACNGGAAAARGRYLVFLNNDTEPAAGWLDALIDAFTRFDGVGLAGCKLLFGNGTLQEAGGIVWNTAEPWNYGRHGNPAEPRFNYTRQVDYVSGAALMIHRDVWERVDGFGSDFAPAYFEDTDLAFKVRAVGYKTVYVPGAVVFHFEGLTSGTDLGAGAKRFQAVNQPKFQAKWLDACKDNGAPAVAPDLAKDRGIVGRALFVGEGVPRPDVDAGSYAMVQEIRLVQALGYKVTYVPTNMAWAGAYTEDLQRRGVETVFAPFVTSVADLLRSRGAEFDLVYLTRYYLAERCLESVRRHAPQAKVLFNNCDLHFLRELRAALLSPDREAALARVRDVRERELAVMRQTDATLSYNPIEHAIIQSHNFERTTVFTCPWVIEVKEDGPDFAEREGLAFLGNYAHPPNLEAVRFFVAEVMPGLAETIPDAVFRVFGSNMTDAVRALGDAPAAAGRVAIEGYVADVADVYGRARVFVAPLLSGAGVKGKVIDAFAHGIPCVLSPVAAEGVGVRDGYDCLIAESGDQWVDAVARLYANEVLWNQLAENAKALVRERFSFERGVTQMREALEGVGLAVPARDAVRSLYSLKA